MDAGALHIIISIVTVVVAALGFWINYRSISNAEQKVHSTEQKDQTKEVNDLSIRIAVLEERSRNESTLLNVINKKVDDINEELKDL